MSIGYPGDLRWRAGLGGGPGDDSGTRQLYAPNCIFPDRWDAQFRQAQALAAQGKKTLNITVYGGSDEVYFATDGLATSWCGLQRARFVAKYGLYGDFFHIRMNIVDSPSWQGTPPIVSNAAGGRVPTPGAYGGTSNFTALNTTLWTFTSPYNCGEVDTIYLDTATAMTVSIDGSAFSTQPPGATSAVTAGGTFAQKRLKITGLDPTKPHVVAIQQTVAQTAIVCGFYAYATTAAQKFGVNYARLTYPGGSVFDWYRQDTNPVNKILQIAGTTAAAVPVVAGFGDPMKPDLMIFASDLAGNDMIQATDVEQTGHGLAMMMSAGRRSVDNVTIASLNISVPNGIDSDLLLANCPPNAALWPDYEDEWLATCAKFSAGVFDLHARWGPNGVAKGFQTQVNGGFHMSPAGITDVDQFLQLGGL